MINLMNPVERNFYGVPSIFAKELISEGKQLDYDEEMEMYTMYSKDGDCLMEFKEFISQDKMDAIVAYMDDELRERIHFYFTPCSNERFIKRYCQFDENFRELLEKEFHIDYI